MSIEINKDNETLTYQLISINFEHNFIPGSTRMTYLFDVLLNNQTIRRHEITVPRQEIPSVAAAYRALCDNLCVEKNIHEDIDLDSIRGSI